MALAAQVVEPRFSSLRSRIIPAFGGLHQSGFAAQGTAWALERLYPHRFARPEVMNQISLVSGGKASAGKLGKSFGDAIGLPELSQLAAEFEE